MNTKKAKHTPGPGVKDIIQAVSSEHLAGMLESASMELDWSDTPDQVRDELEQDAGQIIREAPEMAAKIERLEAVNKELLAALEAIAAEMESAPMLTDTAESRLESVQRLIAKAKGDK